MSVYTPDIRIMVESYLRWLDINTFADFIFLSDSFHFTKFFTQNVFGILSGDVRYMGWDDGKCSGLGKLEETCWFRTLP